MSDSELEHRADHHAREAERLLAGRLGIITTIVKAGAHATLAVYYANQAHRSPEASSDASS
jgi:hypothetical protein